MHAFISGFSGLCVLSRTILPRNWALRRSEKGWISVKDRQPLRVEKNRFYSFNFSTIHALPFFMLSKPVLRQLFRSLAREASREHIANNSGDKKLRKRTKKVRIGKKRLLLANRIKFDVCSKTELFGYSRRSWVHAHNLKVKQVSGRDFGIEFWVYVVRNC